MVEMDVHVCGDGTAVVLHDPDLGRTTGGRGNVYQHTLAQLKELDAGEGERIPTLEEALLCCREVGVAPYIELKDAFSVGATARMIDELGLFDRAVVVSFRPDWLADIRACDARIETSVLFGSLYIDPVALAGAAGARWVHPAWEYQGLEPHRNLTDDWLARVRGAGLKVVSWHEERPSEIAALHRLGVDAICSNAPDLLP